MLANKIGKRPNEEKIRWTERSPDLPRFQEDAR